MRDFLMLHDIPTVWYTPNLKKGHTYQRSERQFNRAGDGICFTVFSFVQMLLSYPFIAP